ncbi:MAG TPA: glutathione S-transferase family protein [Gaiellaceae bacterium]|nr:glutathione S-transferase family protein [Gaiellaceae bacterium]
MLLYDSAVSGNCYKVRLLFAHLGFAYERRELSVTDRSNRPDVLGGLNPALRVPTLVLDDGRSLGESGAILWYFGEGTRFVPDDPYERAQVLQWLFFEQYDHEPNVAVARFWLEYAGSAADAMPDRLDEWHWNGNRAAASTSRRIRRSAPGHAGAQCPTWTCRWSESRKQRGSSTRRCSTRRSSPTRCCPRRSDVRSS